MDSSAKAVAARLGISYRTAKFHIANVLRKFGADRTTSVLHMLLTKQGLRIEDEVIHAVKEMDMHDVEVDAQAILDKADGTLRRGLGWGHSKLTEEQVLEIKRQRKKGVRVRDIAKVVNMNEDSIRNLLTGRSWNDLKEIKYFGRRAEGGSLTAPSQASPMFGGWADNYGITQKRNS